MSKYQISSLILCVFMLVLVCPLSSFAESLHDAASKGDLEKVKTLIVKGADVNAVDEAGNTPLHHATANCALVLQPIEGQGFEAGGTRYKSYTQVPKGYIAVVEFLASKGAAVNAKNKANRTPLHYSAQLGTLDIAKFLVSKGADVNVKDSYGMTPLEHADMNMQGHSKAVAQFLKEYMEQGVIDPTSPKKTIKKSNKATKQ